MRLEEIVVEVLQLSQEERAKLAQKLLLSLDAPSDAEIAEDWLLEAHRRDARGHPSRIGRGAIHCAQPSAWY